MANIKLFENWLAEDESTQGCTITIASCVGKDGNVKPNATSFKVDSVNGTATISGAQVKVGAAIGISSPVTMVGKSTIKLSSADEDVTIECDGKTAKCTIAGKE